MNRKKSLFLMVFLVAAGLDPRQVAAQLQPAGPEVQVNTDWEDLNKCPKLGVAADGSFEIAWGAAPYWAPGIAIKTRHYNASGSPTRRSSMLITDGPEESEWIYDVLAVNPVSTGFRVLMARQEDYSSQKLRFFRRRIAPDGVPAPGDPRPVGSPASQWVFPGPGDVLFAGRYEARQRLLSLQKVDSLGKPVGKLYLVNSRPFVLKVPPVLAPLSDGGWVVAFAGVSIAGPGSPAREVIRARRFNAAGDPVGPDFDVNTTPGGPPRRYQALAGEGLLVAGGPSGRFAVAWEADGSGRPAVVRTRFFDAANAPLTAETTVASGVEVSGPDSMAFDSSGRLLLLWMEGSDAQPGFPSFDLRAQLLGANGSLLGPSINPRSKASADYPSLYCGSVAWAGDSWLIAWNGFYLEDEGDAIFLRRFR